MSDDESMGDNPAHGNVDDSGEMFEPMKSGTKRKTAAASSSAKTKRTKTEPLEQDLNILFPTLGDPELIIRIPSPELLDLPYDDCDLVSFKADENIGLRMSIMNSAKTTMTLARIKCDVCEKPDIDESLSIIISKADLAAIVKLAKGSGSIIYMGVFTDKIVVALRDPAGGRFGTTMRISQRTLPQDADGFFELKEPMDYKYMIVMNVRQLKQTIESMKTICNQKFYELSIYLSASGDYHIVFRSGEGLQSPIDIEFWFKTIAFPSSEAVDVAEWASFLKDELISVSTVLSVDPKAEGSTTPTLPKFSTMKKIVSSQYGIDDLISFMAKSTVSNIALYVQDDSAYPITLRFHPAEESYVQRHSTPRTSDHENN